MAKKVFLSDIENSFEHRYEYKGNKLFLYTAYERNVCEALSENDNKAQDLAEAVAAIRESCAEKSTLSCFDAISQHRFLPKSIIKYPLKMMGGDVVGHVFVTSESGLVLPSIARNAHEEASIVESIVSGRQIRVEIPEDPREIKAFFTTIEGDVRWIRIKGNCVVNGLIANDSKWARPNTFSIERERDLPDWGYQKCLEILPLSAWDEGAPSIIPSVLRVVHKRSLSSEKQLMSALEGLEKAYQDNESPLNILQLWIVVSGVMCQGPDLEELTASSIDILKGGTPGASSSSTLLEWTKNRAEQGFENESQRPTSVKARLDERISQASRALKLYPELEGFTPQALAWCWRIYIEDTESVNSSDSSKIEFPIDERGRDPVFIIHIMNRVIQAYKVNRDMSRDNASITFNTGTNLHGIDAKNWFISVARFLDILKSSDCDYPEIFTIVHDWQAHFPRIMRSARALRGVRSAVEAYSFGPRLNSDNDREYCRLNRISPAHEISWTLNNKNGDA